MGILSTSECSFRLHSENPLHIITGCKPNLNHGGLTWRHDYGLQNITQLFKSIHGIKIFSNNPGYLSPSIVSRDEFRPILVLLLL